MKPTTLKIEPRPPTWLIKIVAGGAFACTVLVTACLIAGEQSTVAAEPGGLRLKITDQKDVTTTIEQARVEYSSGGFGSTITWRTESGLIAYVGDGSVVISWDKIKHLTSTGKNRGGGNRYECSVDLKNGETKVLSFEQARISGETDLGSIRIFISDIKELQNLAFDETKDAGQTPGQMNVPSNPKTVNKSTPPFKLETQAEGAVSGRHMIQQSVDVDAMTNSDDKALLLAADQCRSDAVKVLLAKGANVRAKDGKGATALITVTGKGYGDQSLYADAVKLVKLLLASGVDINAKDNGGQTALMGAAFNGPADLVKLLLASRADVNARDNDGQTVLMKAVTGIPIGPSLDVAKLLLASGADVNARDNDGQTVLMKAANNATVYDEVVKLLLSRGAEVNARNENGLTALAIAARVGRADVVRLLLANGANVITQESSEYQTALTNTVQKGASVTFKIMTAAGQDYQVSLERTVQYKGETFASNGDDQPIRFGILFVVGEDGFPKNAVVVKYIGSELHRTALEKGLIESLQKQKADGPAGAIRSWDGTIEENPSPAQRQ